MPEFLIMTEYECYISFINNIQSLFNDTHVCVCMYIYIYIYGHTHINAKSNKYSAIHTILLSLTQLM